MHGGEHSFILFSTFYLKADQLFASKLLEQNSTLKHWVIHRTLTFTEEVSL